MSIHNVEVYRCRACHEEVALAPAGFTLSDEELSAKAVAHVPNCSAPQYLERTARKDAEDQVR